MLHKLENPMRLEELNPPETLKRIGLKDGDVFCDIGAGTGIFTFSAAEQTKSDIYAVEISDAMLSVLQSKKEERNASHVLLKNDIHMVPASSCRLALLCTVLHELENVNDMMLEIKRILQPHGLLAVIEFHKRPTEMGPPVARRLSPAQIEESLQTYGFSKTDYFELGKNYYALLFSI